MCSLSISQGHLYLWQLRRAGSQLETLKRRDETNTNGKPAKPQSAHWLALCDTPPGVRNLVCNRALPGPLPEPLLINGWVLERLFFCKLLAHYFAVRRLRHQIATLLSHSYPWTEAELVLPHTREITNKLTMTVAATGLPEPVSCGSLWLPHMW